MANSTCPVGSKPQQSVSAHQRHINRYTNTGFDFTGCIGLFNMHSLLPNNISITDCRTLSLSHLVWGFVSSNDNRKKTVKTTSNYSRKIISWETFNSELAL